MQGKQLLPKNESRRLKQDLELSSETNNYLAKSLLCVIGYFQLLLMSPVYCHVKPNELGPHVHIAVKYN